MEQALVFASIVLGVGVAFMLEHLNRLLRSPKVRWHWAQPLFALLVLLQIVSIWWGLAGRTDQTISLGAFLPILYVLLTATLLAAAALPERIPDEGMSLADYYQENRRYQWILYALTISPFALEQGLRVLDGTSNESVAGRLFEIAFPLATIAMIFLRKWWAVAMGFALLYVAPLLWVSRTL